MIFLKGLLLRLFDVCSKIPLENIEATAIWEGLDEFLESEDSSPEVVEYLALHGSRTVSNDFPFSMQNLVLKKGAGERTSRTDALHSCIQSANLAYRS